MLLFSWDSFHSSSTYRLSGGLPLLLTSVHQTGPLLWIKVHFDCLLSIVPTMCRSQSHSHVCPEGVHTLPKSIRNPSTQQKAPNKSNVPACNLCNSKYICSWYLLFAARARYHQQQPPFETFLKHLVCSSFLHNVQALGPILQVWSHRRATYFRQNTWMCSWVAVLRTCPGVQEQNNHVQSLEDD